MAEVRDFLWINEHYAELQEKYPSMFIAVKDAKVLAAGKEFDAVYDEARKRVGRGFVTDYIFSGEPFVLEAELQDHRGRV